MCYCLQLLHIKNKFRWISTNASSENLFLINTDEQEITKANNFSSRLSFESRFESGNLRKAIQVSVDMTRLENIIRVVKLLNLLKNKYIFYTKGGSKGVRADSNARREFNKTSPMVLLRSAEHAAWPSVPLQHSQLREIG